MSSSLEHVSCSGYRCRSRSRYTQYTSPLNSSVTYNQNLHLPTMPEAVLWLHLAVLSCFGLGALRVFMPPRPPLLDLPTPATSISSIPLLLDMQFATATANARLAPPELRAAASAALRGRMRALSAADGCSLSWHVQTATVPANEGAGAGLVLERPTWDARRRQHRMRVTVPLQLTRGLSSCRPLAAASSTHVAACLLNGTASLVNGLADLLYTELAGRACRLARPESRAWRPRSRVSLLLLHWYTMAATVDDAVRDAAVRRSRSACLDGMRAETETLLASVWSAAPPVVHSDMALAGTDGGGSGGGPGDGSDGAMLREEQVSALIEACASGGARCGVGIPPSLGPEPPLRILFYARAPREPTPVLLDRGGHALPTGAGFALPPHGALLPWLDCELDAHGNEARPQQSSLIAQLRVIMGLPERPSPRLLANARANDGTAEGVHWLEAHALQLACTRAYLQRAELQLRMLRGINAASSTYDEQAVHGHAIAAHAHAQNATLLASRGELARACAQAAYASTHAKEALYHPSLLDIPELPEQWWLTTWPPLFLPIATSVLAEAWRAFGSRRHKV